METLFLAWQDPHRRRWFTVGRLVRTNGNYRFDYTNGVRAAQESGFTPVVAFPDIEKSYESREVFPLFANRILPSSRPEYEDYMEWLSISESEADPIAILSRTGGESATDTYEIFPQPERTDDNTYRVHFFVRGLRHQAQGSIERVASLELGERLLLMADLQNPYDSKAFALRTAERTRQDMHILGYLPRYLAHELAQMQWEDIEQARIEVERVNQPPAPVHFRVLCCLEMKWPDGYKPFSSQTYSPLSSSLN